LVESNFGERKGVGLGKGGTAREKKELRDGEKLPVSKNRGDIPLLTFAFLSESVRETQGKMNPRDRNWVVRLCALWPRKDGRREKKFLARNPCSATYASAGGRFQNARKLVRSIPRNGKGTASDRNEREHGS